MKEMTLKELQDCSLDILKDIHSFCVTHGIVYSLSGGSLLGAIRHKGFIPWDDDIDIMMPRPCYEQFCKTYYSDKYKLLEMHNDKSYMLGFGKVCDMNSTYVKGVAWTAQKVGVSVDVFPFDGVQSNFEDFSESCKKMSKVWNSLIINRAIQLGPVPEAGFKIKALSRFVNVFHLKWLNLACARRKLNKVVRQAKSIAFEDSEWCSQIVMFKYGTREYYPSSIFNKICLVSFEGEEFCSIEQYDVYLSRLFGEYMKLPPVEEQVPGHSIFEFYWL